MTRNQNIIFIYGLPCSGKSTLAKAISTRINSSLLSTEQLWALVFNRVESKEDMDFGEDEIDVVYDSIIELTEILLRKGNSVVIEGVFRSNKYREQIKYLANKYNIRLIAIYLSTTESVALNRLELRKELGCISPAGPKTYYLIKDNYYPPDAQDFHIDTTHLSDLEVLFKVIELFEER